MLSDLHGLKEKLEMLESKIGIQMESVKGRIEKWDKLNATYDKDFKLKQKKLNFNVCGTTFSLSVETINTYPDSLFYSMCNDHSLNTKDSIFLNRNIEAFSRLLNFMRVKNIRILSKLSRDKIFELKEEAEFFEVWDLVDIIENSFSDIRIVGMTFSGPYSYKGNTIGTNNFEDLNSTDEKTGVCANSPGVITLELSKSASIKSMRYKGFVADTKNWYPGNGSGSTVYASSNMLDWNKVCSLTSLSDKEKTVSWTENENVKYVKIENKSFVGFSYIYFDEDKDSE